MPFDFHGAEAGPESTIPGFMTPGIQEARATGHNLVFIVVDWGFRIRRASREEWPAGVSGIEDFAHPLVKLRKDCLDGPDGIPVLADGIADFAQGNAAEQGDRTAVGEFFGEVTPEGFQLFFGQILSIPG
jgi:hypothetical protein